MSADKWVLFDLDGTLIRSAEGIWNSVHWAAERMGVPEPEEAVLNKLIGPPLIVSFKQLLGMTEAQAHKALEYYHERYAERGWRENRVYPGIRRVIRTLRRAGFGTGIVTGKPELFTKKILDHYGLLKLFDTVVCAPEGADADKAELIRAALPENCETAWMVGDRYGDIAGGKKAGTRTLGVAYGYGTENELLDAGADRIARTVGEVADVLCPGAETPVGAFLSMEGPDGSGKSTQITKLTDALDRFGFEVVHSREPGGSRIGEKIREILLDRENAEMTDVTEALLYAASRAQHVRETILPTVRAGKVLLCDRYADSSVAYQGGGRGLGVEAVLRMNEHAMDGCLPLVTVYLDIDHRAAMKRRFSAAVPDRLEAEAEDFHARVEDAYHELIRRDPGRFVVVDAARDPDTVGSEIAEKVLKRLLEAESE